jgi:predicted outer membrane lipoprotein
MHHRPFENGYYAGLVNDRANPHVVCSPWWFSWHLGNSVGLDVHCAVVEAVYLKHADDPEVFH